MTTWGDPDAPLVVLALHGRGRDPDDMRATAARFGDVPARFVAPAAPGGSWYPKPFLEPFDENRDALLRALDVVDDRLARLAEAGVGRDRVVLWGFSQGACLAAHHLLVRDPARAPDWCCSPAASSGRTRSRRRPAARWPRRPRCCGRSRTTRGYRRTGWRRRRRCWSPGVRG